MNTTPDYTEAIERGVALLDKTYTRQGWLPYIDIERLDLAQGEFCRAEVGACGCVLAQLDDAKREPDSPWRDGDYFRRARALNIDPFTLSASTDAPTTATYGFTVPGQLLQATLDQGDFTEPLFAPLTAQWKAKLAQLRQEEGL